MFIIMTFDILLLCFRCNFYNYTGDDVLCLSRLIDFNSIGCEFMVVALAHNSCYLPSDISTLVLFNPISANTIFKLQRKCNLFNLLCLMFAPGLLVSVYVVI